MLSVSASTLLPQVNGTPHPATPPLGAFTHVSPLGVLRHIPQRRHDRAKSGRMLLGELVRDGVPLRAHLLGDVVDVDRADDLSEAERLRREP